MKFFEVVVSGRVQGVNFRNGVKKFCDGIGLKGFVRNEENGEVLIVVCCTRKKLDDLILWLKGSPGISKVSGVDIREVDVSGEFDGFKVVRSGSFLKDQSKSLENLMRNVFDKI